MEILLLESHALPLILCYFFHRAAYNDTSPRITYLRVLGRAVAGSYTGYGTCNATLFRLLPIRSNPTATLRVLYPFGYQHSDFPKQTGQNTCRRNPTQNEYECDYARPQTPARFTLSTRLSTFPNMKPRNSFFCSVVLTISRFCNLPTSRSPPNNAPSELSRWRVSKFASSGMGRKFLNGEFGTLDGLSGSTPSRDVCDFFGVAGMKSTSR
jgi:hypothetical protein